LLVDCIILFKQPVAILDTHHASRITFHASRFTGATMSNSARAIDFRYGPPDVWTAICFPDDPHKSLVREDGALLYGFEDRTFNSWRFRRVLEFRLRSAQGALSTVQQTESAQVPVVVTTVTYPKATLTLRAFGHRDEEGRRTDVVLWTAAVHEDVDEFLVAFKIDAYELATLFTGRSYAPANAIFAAPYDRDIPVGDFFEKQSTYLVEDPDVAPPGPIAFVCSPQPLISAHAEGFRPCSSLSIEPTILRGGEAIGGAILVPLNYAEFEHLDLARAESALAETRRFWQELPVPRLPMRVPDPAVNEMIVACARNILQAREIKNGVPEFQVGPTIYRNLFIVDGHFLLECAQYLGYAGEAFAGLDALLRRVRPNGAIAEMEHHRKETAIALATLVRQCELMGREDRLLDLWPTIQNAIGYIESMREEARQLPEDAPNYCLLPDTYADGGIGGKRAEYTTVFWTLVGLKWIGDAARRLGKAADANRAQAAFDDLMADFRRCYARDRRTLADGTAYTPMWMSGSGAHHWITNYPVEVARHHHLRPQSGSWAINNAIFPGEIFAADDPIIREQLQLYEKIDDAEGTPSETGWLPYRSLWGYDASFSAHVWLYAGRPDKALDYLYAFANHAAPTRVWREEQSLAATDNRQICGDMPHNWASAEFIRLVRNLLVFERGETLDLLPGLPQEWLIPGAELYLERTPTRFGPVTLRLTVDENRRFELSIASDPNWQRKPSSVAIHLPAGSTLQVDGRTITATAPLPVPWQAEVTVRGEFSQLIAQ
jgi:hypothetical protein